MHLPILTDGCSKDEATAKQESKIEDILKDAQVDLIVLARYMRIFSEGFCDRNWRRTINIHHSFLPAFVGARPYHRWVEPWTGCLYVWRESSKAMATKDKRAGDFRYGTKWMKIVILVGVRILESNSLVIVKCARPSSQSEFSSRISRYPGWCSPPLTLNSYSLYLFASFPQAMHAQMIYVGKKKTVQHRWAL